MKLLLDQFPDLAQSQGGIPKLRELILQLAVQGKLVPQDPNDEPASVLLEKIKKEKEKLIKAGKIKKQKPLPEISDEEKLFALPNSWKWERLGNSTIIEMGQSPDSKYYNESRVGIPFYQGKTEFGKLFPTPRKWCSQPKKIAEPNDILISVRAPVGPTNLCQAQSCIGRGLTAIRMVGKADNYYYLYTIRAFEKRIATLGVGSTFVAISKKDLDNFLIPIPPYSEQKRIVAKVDNLMALCDQLEDQQNKQHQTRISLNTASLEALTTSESKQEFITNWNRISNNFELLYRDVENVKKLRQTILQLAVMGKLTEGWRKKNPNVLPAPRPGKWFVYVLKCDNGSLYKGHTNDIEKRWIAHINGKGAEWTEKNTPIKLIHWEEYQSRDEAVKREKDLKTGFGRKWLDREIKAGRSRQAGEPANVLLEKIKKEKEKLIKEGKLKRGNLTKDSKSIINISNIPKSWWWVKCDDILFTTKLAGFEYTKYVRLTDEGDVPVIRAQNVRPFKIKENNLKYIDLKTSKLLNRCALTKPALLVTFIGAGIGDVALFDKPVRWHLAPNVAKLESFENCESKINLKYLNYFLISDMGRAEIFKHLKATAQPSLSMGTLRDIDFPLPPIKEQDRIVSRLDQLMTLCDQLEEKINSTGEKSERLMEAVVAQVA